MGVVVVRLSRTHAALIGLVLVATLGGCGGSGEDAGATAAETTEDASSDKPGDAASAEKAEEASGEPAVTSVPRAQFCDAVTDDLVSSALGAPSQWLDAAEPGDVVEYPTGKEKIDSFRCRWQTNKESQDYGADDATFAMAVLGKRATQAVVDERLAQSKDFLKQVGKQLGCEELEVAFGDPSHARVCTFEGDRYNDPSSSLTTLGVFEDSIVTCYVQRNGPGEAAKVEGLEEVCLEAVTAIGS